jgi:uncharacterized protein (TIGR01244 family)
VLQSIALLFAALLVFPAHSAEPLEHSLRELPNARFPAANKVVSGALDASQIALLPGAGIRHVVNLRPPEENPTFDEARSVEDQGLEYHALPIEGAQSLTLENVQALERILEEIGDEPALLHCSSGNRVGALIAIRAAWVQGKSTEEALEIGERWGLKQLEEPVRTLLEARP